ncbi:MAG TPA: xanthan lyase, partial [Candidatus Alistipes pullistercoris]|nr:xanthan lyase [Candidatus Alistipes pullistercoris]
MKIIKKTHAVRLAFLLSGFFAATLPLQAQPLPQDVRDRIGDLLTETARTTIRSGRITIDSVAADKKTLELYAGENCAYIPFREDNVRRIYDGIRELLPAGFKRKEIVLFSDGKRIEELIPAPLRSKADRSRKRFVTKSPEPLVTRANRPYRPTAGLDGRHIALWQSHGYYFEPKLNRWEWQRARIFEIVEDLYTQSYVLPYLVPMLENAGAYVLMPRERDVQTEEAIADNDPAIAGASRYEERNGTKPWTTGEEPGFAYKQSSYKDAENPFRDGTFRQAVTVGHPDDVSTARWTPDIPKGGRYAVYVSYKTLPNSTDDAVYTVRHKGGTTRFRVNQTMGGGTWIYLGHFDFDAGCSESGCVTLSNLSHKTGRIVTADAVKIGGGQGNIARIMPAEQRNPEIDYAYETSGYPRFTEGARYWLQWAGFPDSVYSATGHTNDYRDDYLCRGLWVNYLVGGTKNAPDREGLHIPVDLSLAFHSDAGTTMNDSIIGTLGIYYTHKDDGLYPNGASRDLSRDLTDLVQSQIVSDIQALYEPEWSRRGMWDKAYF